MIKGSCLCGAVRFEIDKAVGPVEVCHCNRCRKLSGSASMTAIGVNTADYRLLSGAEQIHRYEAPILSEPPAYESYFCRQCGSPVPPEDPGGDFFEIAAGLFDDDPGVRPDKHIFIEFVPPWDEIADSLPQYGVRELVRERYGRELPEQMELPTHYGTTKKI